MDAVRAEQTKYCSALFYAGCYAAARMPKTS